MLNSSGGELPDMSVERHLAPASQPASRTVEATANRAARAMVTRRRPTRDGKRRAAFDFVSAEDMMRLDMPNRRRQY